MLTGQLDMIDDPIVAVLVSAFYVPSLAHSTLADIPSYARVATSGTLANRTVSSGVFNADTLVVTGVVGDPVTAVVLVKSSGTASPLITYLNQSADLPKTPDGGNLTFTWDTGSSKIFVL
jgi:hypothetical protein